MRVRKSKTFLYIDMGQMESDTAVVKFGHQSDFIEIAEFLFLKRIGKNIFVVYCEP
jgi:hypothetical protein